jgi:hypothetical protein
MPQKKLQKEIPTPIIYEKPFPQYPFEPEPIHVTSRKTEEELAALISPPPMPKKVTVTPTLTQEVKDRGYRNFEVDLSVARTNAPLGLRAMGIVADTMTIIRADSPFEYRLNSPSNDSTPAEKGMKENEFEIEEVYITNSASSGKAIIRVNWNPRLLRVS